MEQPKIDERPDLGHAESFRRMTDGDPTIRGLLAQHGIARYALFFTTGEGRLLPNGEEELSGSVLTPEGRGFAFWTGWDQTHARPCFRIWRQETPDPSWDASTEYRLAREAVGLA